MTATRVSSAESHANRISHRTAELLNDPGRSEGRLALQVHGGQNVQVRFKDVEVLSDPK